MIVTLFSRYFAELVSQPVSFLSRNDGSLKKVMIKNYSDKKFIAANRPKYTSCLEVSNFKMGFQQKQIVQFKSTATTATCITTNQPGQWGNQKNNYKQIYISSCSVPQQQHLLQSDGWPQQQPCPLIAHSSKQSSLFYQPHCNHDWL